LRALEALPICHCKARRTTHLSLRACEAISLFSLSAPYERDRHALLAITSCLCHCEPAKQSLLLVCQPRTTEIVTMVLTSLLSLRACEAISLFGLPSPHNRNRHATLALLLSLRACEAISLFGLPSLNKRDRHATLALLLSLRACEAISLFCLSAPDKRDRHAALAMTDLPAKQSFFLVCEPRTIEIAALCSPSYCHCEPAKQSLFLVCHP